MVQIELKMGDRQLTLMIGLVTRETFADPVLMDCEAQSGWRACCLSMGGSSSLRASLQTCPCKLLSRRVESCVFLILMRGRIRLRNMLERSGMRRCISGSESRVSIRGSVASSVLFKKDYVMLHSCNINYILNSESADAKLVLNGATESKQITVLNHG